MNKKSEIVFTYKGSHFALNFSKFPFEEHSVSPLLSRSGSAVYKELVMGKGALIWTSGCDIYIVQIRRKWWNKMFEALSVTRVTLVSVFVFL